jgi:glyoxylase-like metal-dependent hydrolase (beta-lactamase superfamily II)
MNHRLEPPPLPATMQVIERGWLSSNSILFDDGDAASVVDTGYATQAAQTVALLDNRRGQRPLTRIINTHLHSDHVGGNAALQRRHAPWTMIPPGQANAVAAWDADALSFAATGQLCERFVHHALLEAGAGVHLGGRDWEVLAAPGHDPHMVMLFEPGARVLISADALWEDGFGAIFPEIEGAGGFADQRAVLELIARRAPLWVVPGHGAAFTDVAAALDRARRRLAALEAAPQRNARHVLKVLVKFWLLQVRSATPQQLVAHFAAARYAQVVHQRFFADDSFAAMIERTVGELCSAGAATSSAAEVANRD